MTLEQIMQLIEDVADDAIQKNHPEMVIALKDAIKSLHQRLDAALQSSAFAVMAEDWSDPSMDVYDMRTTPPATPPAAPQRSDN